MSSGGSGNSQSYTNSNSNSTAQSSAAPPSYIQPYLKQGIGDLSNLYNANYSPTGTPGLAPLSPQTYSAAETAFDYGAHGNGTVNAAQTQAQKFINGDYIDPSANPYWQSSIDASLKPQTDQFMKTILPGIVSSFEGSGRTASGAAQGSIDQAVTGLNRAQSDAIVQANSNQWNQNRSQQLQAINGSPAFAQYDLGRIGAMGEAGTTYDNWNQAAVDAPSNYLARYMALLNGGYPGGESTGSNTGTNSQVGYSYGQPASNNTSSFIGGGLGLGSLALQAAQYLAPAAAAASDRRLKTDIEELGPDPDTGVPIYAYRYKNDPKSYPKVVGPMAQDIAKIRPDLVHEVGGRKVITGVFI